MSERTVQDAGSDASIVDQILTRPPKGYVFTVMATQDSHYDLFMLTLARRALQLKMKTLEVVTEARNRSLMSEMAELQSDHFGILEVAYGQNTMGNHVCSPHLHEINIQLRSLRKDLMPSLVLFEGLTPLLIDFAARDVVQFFKECVEESIKLGTNEFYLVHEDTADAVTINQLYSLSQGIITLSTARGKHYLAVKKAKGVELPYNPIEYVPNMSSDKQSEWEIVWNW
ncbi:hypothetical protein EU546_06695 [Candidatus Thorarchaeota archaeon]|nr:MAG: hypothetical protein EU546_06695 [Candidatus Thorarchaeota archaeon]